MPGGSEGEKKAERPSGRGRRVVRVLILGVLGLYAAYMVAANLLLQTPFVESLTNTRPEKLLITYRRAFTFFPGHVLAYGVSVRNQASRSQLQITAEKVWAVANPLPLLAKEVRILKGKVWARRSGCVRAPRPRRSSGRPSPSSRRSRGCRSACGPRRSPRRRRRGRS